MKLIASLVLSAVMIGATGIQGSGDGLATSAGHNPFASPLAGGPQVNARSLADSRLAPVHPPASPASAPPASQSRRIASAMSVLRGVASWYGTGPGGMTAAAGPRLRVGDWRGRVVSVCAESCIRVRLIDFCLCPQRLIDLSADAFGRLSLLSRGVIVVTIREARDG